jgi:hypothetical protein
MKLSRTACLYDTRALRQELDDRYRENTLLAIDADLSRVTLTEIIHYSALEVF